VRELSLPIAAERNAKPPSMAGAPEPDALMHPGFAAGAVRTDLRLAWINRTGYPAISI
jgi:hypothetical protein